MPHRSSDPLVYLPPPLAAEAPREQLAYVALASEPDAARDGIGVVDTAPGSPTLGRMIGRVDFPHSGDQLRRLVWSSCGPTCAHSPRTKVERRYLIAPGTRTSRIHIVDTEPDPRSPRLVKVVEGEELMRTTCYSAHAEQCWVHDRAAEHFACDIDSVRPANNPARAYGFAGVMVSVADLSAAVFLRYLSRGSGGQRGEWKAQKVITIRARPAAREQLPPLLRDVGLVPPLVTDVNLSPDDQWLYVSCWGTGELRRYDVADPFNPVLTGTARLGGIVRRTAHPGTPGTPRNGGPQMTDVSRDGRRVYVTNALHAPYDAQFYPDGVRGWMARIDAHPTGRITIDPAFFVEFDPGIRPHQVRLLDPDVDSR